MSGDPIRWRAVRLAVFCAIVGVAALVIKQRTSLHGSHTIVGIDIKDQERQLLGDAGVLLLIVALILLISAFMEPDGLTRTLAGPTTLLMLATVVGGALVFAAYRVQRNAANAHGPPPVVQVDCPIHGGACFNVTGQGGTYLVPPSGPDALNNCTWSDAGRNPAGTQEVYDCR